MRTRELAYVYALSMVVGATAVSSGITAMESDYLPGVGICAGLFLIACPTAVLTLRGLLARSKDDPRLQAAIGQLRSAAELYRSLAERVADRPNSADAFRETARLLDRVANTAAVDEPKDVTS